MRPGASDPPTIEARETQRPVRRLAIVTAGENPSFDYYLAPRLALHAAPPMSRFDLSAPRRTRETADWADTFIIFCRYVSRGWLSTLEAHAGELAGVGLFIDDDVAALAAGALQSLRYRWKLRRLATDRWPRLTPMLDAVWVSTAPLAELWSAKAPRLTPPLADEADLATRPMSPDRPLVALHATSSHDADQRWLAPVVRAVLAADPAITFEVVARSERFWRGDERVRVIPYRSWPDYRADTAAHGRDLMLAPLLPSAANAARADVKRIDAARCGAALLVSDRAVFQVSQAEAALGMAAPLDAATWTRRILELMGDPERRRALVDLNRAKLSAARQAATGLFAADGAGIGGAWRLI